MFVSLHIFSGNGAKIFKKLSPFGKHGGLLSGGYNNLDMSVNSVIISSMEAYVTLDFIGRRSKDQNSLDFGNIDWPPPVNPERIQYMAFSQVC